MARARRFVFRLLLAVGLSAGAYLAWVSAVGSPAAVDVLPPGAFAVVEVRDAEGLARHTSGTRFAAAFARSATRESLERTEAVRAFDEVLSEVGRISGVSLGRDSAFDLVGAETAVGWYPPSGAIAATAPWVAAGRLSVRAWTVASALRLARRFGLGAASLAREEIPGAVLYSLPGSAGASLHVFLAGRVLVGSLDRALALKAARASVHSGEGVTREPAWLAIRGALPARGELFAWVREPNSLFGVSDDAGTRRLSVGVRIRAGSTITIDAASETASAPPAAKTTSGAPAPLPGIDLLRQGPLFLLTSRDAVPDALVDLLKTRERAVARRHGGMAAALRPSSGFAVIVTDSARGSGLFPMPRGLALIGMASADEAARALPSLFPPGSRTATVGGTRALATRESFPLAGEFELWGAAIGPRLVFATDFSLLDAARADADVDGDVDDAGHAESPSWPVDSVASFSMQKLLPLLRRWVGPLSGLVAANWPAAPDLSRDLGLLAAVDEVRASAGSDGRFERAVIALDVHDLQAAANR